MHKGAEPFLGHPTGHDPVFRGYGPKAFAAADHKNSFRINCVFTPATDIDAVVDDLHPSDAVLCKRLLHGIADDENTISVFERAANEPVSKWVVPKSVHPQLRPAREAI